MENVIEYLELRIKELEQDLAKFGDNEPDHYTKYLVVDYKKIKEMIINALGLTEKEYSESLENIEEI